MNRLLSSVLLAIAMSLASCDRASLSGGGSESSSRGGLALTVKLGDVGVLARSAAGGAPVERLVLELAAEGEATVRDTVVPGYGKWVELEYRLASDKKWTLWISGFDDSDSALYSQRTEFVLKAGATTPLEIELAARFSDCEIRFPVVDSLKRLVLSIDGKVVGDSSFPGQANLGAEISFFERHLRASPGGVEHAFSLKAYGAARGGDALLYALDTSLSIVSGEKRSFPLVLHWVGPAEPPPGNLDLAVNLGTVGRTEFLFTYPDTAKAWGTMVDARDGSEYRTRLLGKRVWMLQDMGAGCARCDPDGRLFDESTFMDACPSGWHVPDTAEWRALVRLAATGGDDAIGAYHLRSRTGKWWAMEQTGTRYYHGDDALGFDLRAWHQDVECCYSGGGYHVVGMSILWTSTRGVPYIRFDEDGVGFLTGPHQGIGGGEVASAPVRCVSD